jgi:hypothetical protein
MSVITLELTETHVKLLKHLRWSLNRKGFIVGTEDDEIDPAAFGENNIYDAIDLILNGLPADFDPLNTEDLKVYSEEQMDEWDKLYSELPIALDIIMFNGSFELGTYKTKFHDRNWRKIN